MKKFNINELIWFLILVLSSILLMYLLRTSNIANFVHPKMNKYLAFAVGVLLVIACIQFFKIFTVPDRGGIRRDYFIFMAAIIAIGLATNKDMGTEGINLKGIKLSTRSYWDVTGDNHHHFDKIPEGVIQLIGENYYCYLEDIEKNINKFKGRQVITEGLVYKNKSMNKNEFIIARSVMSCCAADSQIIGIKVISQFDKIYDGQWVQIKGTLSSTTVYEGNKLIEVPIIKADSFEVTKKPANQYIYQN
ncbi:TIGR03943 family protein [Clostridium sp. YIM B02505]|uniref:TIGR03943 family protein n=1 Tax=Clostridium yunnanense TaxID=2800325 RepID=A0ABS1EVT7_9CLOT|nr:TIGR03943 family protein [Clostridium yunnanense]MBK1813484.1 TIGR03943 family protein [Clostridium yunnanense]